MMHLTQISHVVMTQTIDCLQPLSPAQLNCGVAKSTLPLF